MPYQNRKAWYVDSVNYAAVTAWAATTAKTVGQFIRQTAPAVGSERVFVCGVAGTTGGSEPTWVLTNGSRSPAAGSDGSVVWFECTGAAGVNGDMTNVMAANDALIRNQTQVLGQVIRNVSNGTPSLFLCTTTASAAGATEPAAWNTTTGATTTDGGATWTCLGPQSGFSPFGAPDARLETSYAKANASSANGVGSTTYIASSHSQTQASALGLTPNGTGVAPTALICVGKTHAPPTSADETTGASLFTTGNFPLTLSGQAGGLHYSQGVTYSAGSGVTTSVSLLLIAQQSNIYKNCSLILGGTGPQQIQLGSGRQIAVLDNTTMTFGGTGQSVTLSGFMRWRNTANALLGTLPTGGLFGFIINGVGALLEGVDLSAMTNTWPLVQGPSFNGNVVFKDCKITSGQQIMAAGAPSAIGGVEATLIRADSGATNYRTEKYQWAGTQTTETTIVRTGGATDGATPISHKVVTTANSALVGPFENIPLTIWNPTVGSTVNVNVFGIWGGGAVPNNDNIWFDVEYPGSTLTPMGSWTTNGKATFLTSAAAQTTDTSTWGGSTTPFKMTVAITPQMAGPITVYVKCATPSTTFYIDPKITLT